MDNVPHIKSTYLVRIGAVHVRYLPNICADTTVRIYWLTWKTQVWPWVFLLLIWYFGIYLTSIFFYFLFFFVLDRYSFWYFYIPIHGVVSYRQILNIWVIVDVLMHVPPISWLRQFSALIAIVPMYLIQDISGLLCMSCRVESPSGSVLRSMGYLWCYVMLCYSGSLNTVLYLFFKYYIYY